MSSVAQGSGGVVAIGLRAQRGGAIAVGVAGETRRPRVVLCTWLATAVAGDRLAYEPYHVAFEMARGTDGSAAAKAAAAIAVARDRQNELALKGMSEIVRTVREQGAERIVAALLVNRAEWVGELLAYSLESPHHPPVAEGLAVRQALRLALGRCAIELAELDEKSLFDRTSKRMGIESADLTNRLKVLGTDVGRPWRKEHKLACLAAWATLAGVAR